MDKKLREELVGNFKTVPSKNIQKTIIGMEKFVEGFIQHMMDHPSDLRIFYACSNRSEEIVQTTLVITHEESVEIVKTLLQIRTYKIVLGERDN